MHFRNAWPASMLVGTILAVMAIPASAGHQESAARDAVAFERQGAEFVLENRTIRAMWSMAGGRLGNVAIRDRVHGTEVDLEGPFRILLKDGTVLSSADLKVSGELKPTQWLIAVLVQHDLYHAGEINHLRSLRHGTDRWAHEAE